ncbi:hypothetical protein HA402_001247 [Bradysia odoriphaga]|nr:hypothetical protein HA402_001247 [Bradysia odoriphaga]
MNRNDNIGLTNVQNCLSAYVSINNNLRHYRNTNVVVRSDIESLQPNIVRIITGGGSGHEPAHSGYVGDGMITAAVCGEIFASPSVLNILSAILSVAKPGTPVLLIVTNYTGDRLNFGLAGEIAKTRYGYDVEMLLVDDDCAIENVRKSVGKRGLAGTVLIHKIAGAMAAKGADLKEIHDFCGRLLKNERLVTVGFTFTSASDRIRSIEIGRGVHGEPGIMKLEDEPNFERIIEIIMEKLLKKVACGGRKSKILLMFNNLGGTSQFTMSTFAHSFLQRAKNHFDIQLVLQGEFMTSLHAEGISVTILHLLDDDKDTIIDHIKYPVEIAANVPFNINRSFDPPDDRDSRSLASPNIFKKAKLDQRFYRIKYDGTAKDACNRAVAGACLKLLENRNVLNEMDAEFGDSDTGSLIATGATTVHQALINNEIDVAHPAVMLHNLSEVLQKNMGGSLGALLCIFLQAASAAVHSNADSMHFWLSAMKLGISAVQKYGLADLGDRTMLDALQCGVEQFELKVGGNQNVFEAVTAFAAGCEQGANNTKNMMPKSGRAAYVFSEGKTFTAEVNDPGAQVIAIIAREVCHAIMQTSDL